VSSPDTAAEAGGGLAPDPGGHELLAIREGAAREHQPGATEPAPRRAAAETEPSGGGDEGHAGLFGRGLLYVVVFSLQTVAATVVSPILAHLIGPTEFGRLASVIALYQLLTVLTVIGMDQAVVLQRQEDGNDRSARGLIMVSFLIISAITLLVGLTAPLWSVPLGYGPFSPLLLATLLWTGPGACVQVMLALLLAEDRLRIFTTVSALAALGGQLIGILLLVAGSNTATTYAWGGVVSQLAALVIGLFATRPRLRGLLDLATARRAVKFGVPLMLGGISAFVLNAGDRIIIQRFLGAAEVGRYQVAYTVGYVVVMLLVFTSQAWTPRFAAIRDRTERMALVERSRNELYRLLIPMILGITLGAPVALRIVAPASYRPESLLLVVFLVALSAFPVAAGGAITRELFAMRRGRSIATAAAVAAASNVLLNIIWVPRFGIAGSAAATVVAFSLQSFVLLRAVPKEPRWPRAPGRVWLGIIAACAISAGTTFLPQTLEWNVTRLVVGLACLPWFILRLNSARTGGRAKYTARKALVE
jgi:O-antigen/teichoic acid export membrane protein